MQARHRPAFGRLAADMVTLKQPVVAMRNGRECTVMISVREYRRHERLDRRVIPGSSSRCP
jgi:hypothetical protein